MIEPKRMPCRKSYQTHRWSSAETTSASTFSRTNHRFTWRQIIDNVGILLPPEDFIRALAAFQLSSGTLSNVLRTVDHDRSYSI